MKVVYTEVRNPLTPNLVKLAEEAANQGRRVFYIVPNSMSFEKEKQVLQLLEGQASFEIMVTRFSQMARYLVLNEGKVAQSIDDIGLSMIFFRILSQFRQEELKVYGKLRQDLQFVSQLVALYKELQTANLTVLDLESLSSDKLADLTLIFTAVETFLQEHQYEKKTPLSQFTDTVSSGEMDDELANLVLVIDHFTRFSAEEEALISALNDRVADIIIGCYASQKAYHASYIEGNLYQDSVDFLRYLSQAFRTKPIYLASDKKLDALGKITKNCESYYDFSREFVPLSDKEKRAITLWNATNQKEEVEAVAKAIRYHLEKGGRYKDILVLLGDVKAYQLQIQKLFERYEIPYYLGKAEEMSHHPLVHFIESLERLKRYSFRTEDVLNLLKSGLYGRYSQKELDTFEQYLLFIHLEGRVLLNKEFTVNPKQKYPLEHLNHIRQDLAETLGTFLDEKPQSARSLLEKAMCFFQKIGLTENLAEFARSGDDLVAEREEEVFKAFVHLLELLELIFGEVELSLADFLALLRVGMQSSCYRLVPATVDVVAVKSYELIVPHASQQVYALGLTKSHFPKIARNTSLLTDEERLAINEGTRHLARFDIASKENVKKNHFAFLSLINSAKEKLVLSCPQLINETEDTLSPYIKLLSSMGIPMEEKGRLEPLTPETIGHYKGLLSRVIKENQVARDHKGSEEEEAFWGAVMRFLDKKLNEQGLSLPILSQNIETRPLSAPTLAVLYGQNQPLQLSTSSLSDFYSNEYLYFVRHILRLEETRTLRPDARSHGTFLHRIFERVMADTGEDFDGKLDKAIAETRKEAPFSSLYQENAQAAFSESVLLDIARATSLILKDQTVIDVLEDEAVFGDKDSHCFYLDDGQAVVIRGKIDRLDALKADGALGVVDYKSSANQFKIDRFYNGLSPQLLTYLSAIQKESESLAPAIFGAMYLHMLDPIVKLSDVKKPEDLFTLWQKELVYRGIFIEDESQHLDRHYQASKSSLFDRKELEILLEYNQRLYKEAAQKIVAGRFSVNPYTADGLSVGGEQLKAMTGFEANRHLAQARRLVKVTKREEWLDLMQKGGQK